MNPDIFLITGSLGVCLALAVLVIVLVDRARLRADVRDRLAKTADPYDVGPDALQLLHDLDTHLNEYVAADTELAAGFDRLRQAIRDEQNNHKGDS